MNTEGGIESNVCVKAERPEMLTVAQWSSPSEWGQEISWRRRLMFSVLVMAGKEVKIRVTEGYWYGSHAINGTGSLWENNLDRRICRYAS